MATNVIVRPAIPLAGGGVGMMLARLHGLSARDTLLYGLLGAGLAWAGAAAIIMKAGLQETSLTPIQAQQLAGIIADRERQAQALPVSSLDRQRINREVAYLTAVLSKGNYQYQGGNALKMEGQ